MSIPIDESSIYTHLRDRAEAHLKAGTTPPNSHWSMGIDALRLLHRLSSNPDSAEDALKLLHELQVHQVELELQNTEIASNEQALVEELNLYRGLYDSAPLAYFLVDREGMIIQGNHAAAVLFDTDQDTLAGLGIDSFLAPEYQPQLLELLQRAGKSSARESCLVKASDNAETPRHLQFLASSSSTHEHVLLACCEYPVNG